MFVRDPGEDGEAFSRGGGGVLREGCDGKKYERGNTCAKLFAGSQQFRLAAFVVQERRLGEKSRFMHFLNAFPESYAESFPYWWSVEELALLKNMAVGFKTVYEVADACHAYCVLAMNGMRQDIGTLDEFLWAVCVVVSRQNPFPMMYERKRKTLLIPGFDMCNHEMTEKAEITTVFNFQTGVFECSAQRDFAKGEEYTIYYGHRPDRDLFLYSGFVCCPPGSNQHNSISIIPTTFGFGFMGKDGGIAPDAFLKVRSAVCKNVPGIEEVNGEVYRFSVGGPYSEDALRAYARARAISTKEEAASALRRNLSKDKSLTDKEIAVAREQIQNWLNKDAEATQERRLFEASVTDAAKMRPFIVARVEEFVACERATACKVLERVGSTKN